MNFRISFLLLFAIAAVFAPPCWAVSFEDNSVWKESETPPPLTFDLTKLIAFDVSPNSSMVYAIDPAAVQISNSDGVIRYIVVATSATGARNVLYEGIHCATGEVKTYAQFNPKGQWSKLTNPEWRSMSDLPSKHALKLAQAAVCDNATPASTASDVARRLKHPNSRLGN